MDNAKRGLLRYPAYQTWPTLYKQDFLIKQNVVCPAARHIKRGYKNQRHFFPLHPLNYTMPQRRRYFFLFLEFEYYVYFDLLVFKNLFNLFFLPNHVTKKIAPLRPSPALPLDIYN